MKLACTALLLGGATALFDRPSTPEEFSPFVAGRNLDVPNVGSLLNVKAASLELAAGKMLSGVLPGYDLKVTNAYTTAHNGVTHVYAQQTINDIPVYNGMLNANVLKDGSVSSVHDKFFPGNDIPSAMPELSAHQALASFGGLLGNLATDQISVVSAPAAGDAMQRTVLAVPTSVDEDGRVEARLNYVQSDNGKTLSLAWFLELYSGDDYFYALMDARSGELVALENLVDWANVGDYNAWHIPISHADEGPAHFQVEPLQDSGEGEPGWHQWGRNTYTDTRGNNCYAQENFSGSTIGWENNERPQGSTENGTLTFPQEGDLSQDAREYWEATTVNLFTIINSVHDIWYAHGFDEVSGNFQMENYGRGGQGNDGVIGQSQDGSGTNNANFMTPPDGQRGRMRMYIWNTVTPRRDSSLDNGIVIHEFAHGLSNRLTGGPNVVNCLGGGQPGGMGEGWGDLFGTLMRMREEHTRDTVFGMGTYVLGQNDDGAGIRGRRYCLDDECNNGRFSDNQLPSYRAVHAKGELWCNFNYEVYWNLRDKHGFTEDQYSQSGDKLFYTLLLDGMKLQPCNPSFLDARDGIIEADEINFDGDNKCELWCGYAKRGMGMDATTTSHNVATDGYEVPSDCNQTCRDIYGDRFPFGPVSL